MSLATQIVADVAGVFMNADHFAVAITYERRGATVTVNAMVEPSQFPSLGDEGGATKYETRGYLIESSTLIIEGVATTPEIGDTITEGTRVYIVPKKTDGPRWEYADENRLLIRVNTTYKGTT
jgi:hypothetical protein